MRRQNEEHAQEREAEDRYDRDALLRFLLLEAHAHVVEAHLGRHGLAEDLLQGPHCLGGADPRHGDGVNLGRAVQVEAHGELRAGPALHRDEGGEGDPFPLPVMDVGLADVLHPAPGLGVGLDVDLPLPAEAVKVVDEVAAHERLKRLVHFGDVQPLPEHLVPIHLHEELRRGRLERGGDHGELGPLLRGCEELGRVLGQEAHVLAGPVLEDECGPTRHSDPLDRGRGERKSHGLGEAGQPLPHVGHDGPELLLGLPALAPVFQRHEIEGAGRTVVEAQEADPRDTDGVLHAGRRLEDLVNDIQGRVGALQRGGVGQGDVYVEIALILLRHEAGGDALPEQAGESEHPDQEHDAHARLPDQAAAAPRFPRQWHTACRSWGRIQAHTDCRRRRPPVPSE